MQHPITVSGTLAALFTVAGVASSAQLQAQATAGRRPSQVAIQLGSLSRERAFRWAAAAPVIHCSPAPLTERPGVAAEMARPRTVPLEQSFLDAASVKRALVPTTPLVGR